MPVEKLINEPSIKIAAGRTIFGVDCESSSTRYLDVPSSLITELSDHARSKMMIVVIRVFQP